MSLNEEFERDPLAFLKKYPFNPGQFNYAPMDRSHSRGEDQIFTPRITKHYFGNKAAKYYADKGQGPVKGILNYSWEPTGHSFNLEKGLENAVNLVRNLDETEWGIEMYYLPWSPQAVTSMQLPRHVRGHPTCDYFTTSSLSGCSVFVRGHPETPTIYHAGCYEGALHETVSLWRRCMDKLAEQTQYPQYEGIDKYDYTKTSTHPGGLKVDSHTLVDAYNIAHSEYDFTPGGPPTVRVIKRMEAIQSSGCVVGIRDQQTKRWSFYLQERLKYEIIEPGGHVGAPPRRQEYFTPVSLRKFFPGGTRNAQLITRYRFK